MINEQITEDGLELDEFNEQGYGVKFKRFCDQIRFNQSLYTKYFNLVHSSKSFRLYKLD